MKPIGLAIFISGNGSNLQAIIDAIQNGLSAEIKVVISNKADAYGLIRAQKANIPTEIIPSSKDRQQDEKKLLDCLARYQPQLIILAGYMRILTPRFIAHYHNRILNIHPSLLPKHQGMYTHQRVLAAGDTEHGCSVHLVTEKLDSGPIIAQSHLQVLPGESPDTLQQRVNELERRLYPKVIELYAQGRLTFENHQVMLDGKEAPPEGFNID